MTPQQALQVIEQFRQAWTGGTGRDHDLLRDALVALQNAVNGHDDTRPST